MEKASFENTNELRTLSNEIDLSENTKGRDGRGDFIYNQFYLENRELVESIYAEYGIEKDQQRLLERVFDVKSAEELHEIGRLIQTKQATNPEMTCLEVGCIDQFAEDWAIFMPDELIICDPGLGETSFYLQPEQVLTRLGVARNLRYTRGNLNQYVDGVKEFEFEFAGKVHKVTVYAAYAQEIVGSLTQEINGIFLNHVGHVDGENDNELKEGLDRLVQAGAFVDSSAGRYLDGSEFGLKKGVQKMAGYYFVEGKVTELENKDLERLATEVVNEVIAIEKPTAEGIRTIISDKLRILAKVENDRLKKRLQEKFFEDLNNTVGSIISYFNETALDQYGQMYRGLTPEKVELTNQVIKEVQAN